jgi:imidazole glycerol-phosphate synthase subunit HisH
VKNVAIVDYGMCNLDSVSRAIEECGGNAVVTDDAKQLGSADHLILPGVGSFAEAMDQLRRRGLEALLVDLVEQGVPFLGICLGMQLMASRGEEGQECAGLGIVPGEVRRLEPDRPDTRIPHIGWNDVSPVCESALFRGLRPERDFYFVHSYHFVCHDPQHVLARTPYCGSFVSAISSGPTVYGVQFHPEKSQKAGFQLLKNFIAL